MSTQIANRASLEEACARCEALHQQYASEKLGLDITRGKPSAEQLDLSAGLLQALTADETNNANDLRNYGILDGLPEAKELFGALLDVTSDQRQQRVFVGGNSSLSLMHYSLFFANFLGLVDGSPSWQAEAAATGQPTKILCPVPGYDRHFALCQELGIEMIPVALTGSGPDMDEVERLVANDASIKGIWCVPRFSNPTGEVYSDDVVARLAVLGQRAGQNFYVFWDNAYAVHALDDDAAQLASIDALASAAGTLDTIIQFGSTSKVTLAGAGIGYMASSQRNIAAFTRHFGKASIGSDKINQLRHVNFLQSPENVAAHMREHAKILVPKFQLVEKTLAENFGDNDMGEWQSVKGGYFVSFNTRPGLANEVVRLAAEVGVKLTPAGATFPYGEDPQDRNIRIAPTYPDMEELEKAMEVFANCVKLASYRQELAQG